MGESLVVPRGIGAKGLFLLAILVSSPGPSMFIRVTHLAIVVSVVVSTVSLMTIKGTGFSTPMALVLSLVIGRVPIRSVAIGMTVVGSLVNDTASRELLLEYLALTLTSSFSVLIFVCLPLSLEDRVIEMDWILLSPHIDEVVW
ncbi:hypothetical protein V6N11_081808 [Hibiscus sabdariffa]|uniref:Uncharacterized protein n=1 Tax=Hibiscus sabdariffa TaxID=183260 RepID=A0ABR2Q7A8_9ROSI